MASTLGPDVRGGSEAAVEEEELVHGILSFGSPFERHLDRFLTLVLQCMRDDKGLVGHRIVK